MEVTDELIYYLVKAVCFMIISTVANFFEQIHSIQEQKTVEELREVEKILAEQ
jgi:hypothetical protein